MANAIYKKLWMVILFPLVAAGIAWFLTRKDSEHYKSTAVIRVSIPDTAATSTRSLREDQDPDQYYENVMATMKTERITSMVTYRLLMHDLDGELAFRPPAINYTPQRKSAIRSKLEQKLASRELLTDADVTEETISKVVSAMDYDVARWLREGNVLVSRQPSSSDIEISVLSEDPFLSAYAANAFAQEYIRYEEGKAGPEAPKVNDSIAFFRSESERLRLELEQVSGELKEAQAASAAPADEVRFRRARANRIAEYEMKIVEQEFEANNIREQLAKLQVQSVPPAGSGSKPAIDVASSAKIQTIRKKIDQLTRIYRDGGSKDRELDSIITRLQTQVDEESARLQRAIQKPSTTASPGAYSKEREMLMARLSRREETIRSLRNDIRRARQVKMNTADPNAGQKTLLAKAEAVQQEYNRITARLQAQESKGEVSASAKRGNHLAIKSKALPSAQPESPYALLIIFGSFLATLIVCIVVIAVTRPAPKADDSIFLKVNYGQHRERQRRKKEDLGTVG